MHISVYIGEAVAPAVFCERSGLLERPAMACGARSVRVVDAPLQHDQPATGPNSSHLSKISNKPTTTNHITFLLLFPGLLGPLRVNRDA